MRKSYTPEYRVWAGMKSRCVNPNSTSYRNYGGRGIKVCDRWWNSFEVFLADMGPRPHGASIDRIDNDGNYEPGNCRWADSKTQGNNRRNNLNAPPGKTVHIRVINPDDEILKMLAAQSNRSVQQVGRIAISAGLVGKKLNLEALSSYGGSWGPK